MGMAVYASNIEKMLSVQEELAPYSARKFYGTFTVNNP